MKLAMTIVLSALVASTSARQLRGHSASSTDDARELFGPSRQQQQQQQQQLGDRNLHSAEHQQKREQHQWEHQQKREQHQWEHQQKREQRQQEHQQQWEQADDRKLQTARCMSCWFDSDTGSTVPYGCPKVDCFNS